MGDCRRSNSEYYIYTPNRGFFESMGWNGVSYSKSIGGAFAFTKKGAARDVLVDLSSDSYIIDAESLPERMIEYDHKTLLWNRDARDIDGLSDRDLLEELCRRVVDYHASSLKFHDCERGTVDELMENDNNYCRIREVVQHVLGIDLEYVEEVKN